MDLSKKMPIEILRGGYGGLHLVFSDQRLNYTGFCVFEDLLVQEEDLLLVQEAVGGSRAYGRKKFSN